MLNTGTRRRNPVLAMLNYAQLQFNYLQLHLAILSHSLCTYYLRKAAQDSADVVYKPPRDT
jgi:hypothetical protein